MALRVYEGIQGFRLRFNVQSLEFGLGRFFGVRMPGSIGAPAVAFEIFKAQVRNKNNISP